MGNGSKEQFRNKKHEFPKEQRGTRNEELEHDDVIDSSTGTGREKEMIRSKEKLDEKDKISSNEDAERGDMKTENESTETVYYNEVCNFVKLFLNKCYSFLFISYLAKKFQNSYLHLAFGCGSLLKNSNHPP